MLTQELVAGTLAIMLERPYFIIMEEKKDRRFETIVMIYESGLKSGMRLSRCAL